MRWAVAAGVIVAGLLASSCENCSCPGIAAPTVVLLTEADANSVVVVGAGHDVGVELNGGGRTITASDPKRFQTLSVPQPSDKTLEVLSPLAERLSTGLWAFGGSVILTSPRQGSHAGWQATVIIATGEDVSTSPIYVAPGVSWTYTWPAGGSGPITTNARVLASVAPSASVTTAVVNLTTGSVTVSGTFEQQMFYAATLGMAGMEGPLPEPRATNEDGPWSYFVVRANPDWSCSVESGCAALVAGGDPVETYGNNPTPPSDPCLTDGRPIPGCT
jgi:hypothetical protein